MSELPSSWRWSTIGDLAVYIQRGKSPKYAERSDLPVVNQRCIRWNQLEQKHLKFIHPDQFSAWDSARYIRAGDVLWNSTGTGTVGRAYLVREADCVPPKVVDSHVTIVRHVPEVDPRYLFNWIKSPAVQDKIEEMCDGTTNQIELSRTAIAAIAIPIAPAAEQARIADQLSTLLARIQACNDRLDAIPALLKRFRQAVLQAAISGELLVGNEVGSDGTTHQLVMLGEEALRIPGSWQVVDVGQATDPARPLCYGVVQPGAETSEGVPLIRVQDMEAGSVLKSQLRTVSSEVDQEYRRSRVAGGEVLISVVGTIGRTAIVPAGMKANIARAVARLACRDGVLNLWLHYWLSTESLQWHLLRSAKEVARKTLNLADLARIPLALPSPEEQAQIVNRVLELFAFADAIEARHASAVAHVRRLTPLTLAKAFRGELVQQDANDEPASALLARITAQRSATAPVTEAKAPRRGRPTRAPKETAAMTKSRQDDDVMNQPYLAGHLRRIGSPASADALFKLAELPVDDFYKQLAWEVAQGHVKDNQTTLEPSHAAG
jgi:type I restriction enzyme S subunit